MALACNTYAQDYLPPPPSDMLTTFAPFATHFWTAFLTVMVVPPPEFDSPFPMKKVNRLGSGLTLVTPTPLFPMAPILYKT